MQLVLAQQKCPHPAARDVPTAEKTPTLIPIAKELNLIVF